MAKNKLPPWLRPKGPGQKISVSVAWYASEEHWQKVKTAATDPDRFEETYPQWVAMVEASLKEMLAAGIDAKKAAINAEAFLAWCLAHSKPNDAASRAQYVSEAASSS